MIRQDIKRITSLALITSMIACTFPYASVPVHAQTQMDEQPAAVTTTQDAAQENRLTTNYSTVSKSYKEAVYTGDAIVYRISEAVAKADRAFLTNDNYEYVNDVLAVKAGDTVTLTLMFRYREDML